jgi:hypothetical protein
MRSSFYNATGGTEWRGRTQACSWWAHLFRAFIFSVGLAVPSSVTVVGIAFIMPLTIINVSVFSFATATLFILTWPLRLACRLVQHAARLLVSIAFYVAAALCFAFIIGTLVIATILFFTATFWMWPLVAVCVAPFMWPLVLLFLLVRGPRRGSEPLLCPLSELTYHFSHIVSSGM